jgi:yecA family protein
MGATTAVLPDYEQASAALELAGIEPGVAEVHGIVCGVLASPGADKVDWLATVLRGDSDLVQQLPKPVSEQLLGLYQSARKALGEDEFGLTLLLPGESSNIVERTDALAAWCRGFLLGLAEGGLSDFSSLSNEAREALEDLIDIAEGVAEDEADEQQEHALAEVEEYVRVAVQFLFDECHRATETH